MCIEKPNVLWIFTDEQRKDSMGVYGSSWAKTPHLDRFACEGVLFENAVTPAPVCVPARASILTGKYPVNTGVLDNKYSTFREKGIMPDYLTHVFRNNGYATASFGKQHYESENRAFETEEGPILSEHVDYFKYSEALKAEDFLAVQYKGEYPWILGGTFPLGEEMTPESHIVNKAMEWISSKPATQPFFLRVSFNGPHTPVVPPHPYDQVIDADSIVFPQEVEDTHFQHPEWISQHLMGKAGASLLTKQEIALMRQFYYGYVSYIDHKIGELTSWMEQMGWMENTILIFNSDHGTHLGDFGLVQKQTFYEASVSVPLLFWYPKGFSQGKRIQTPVETRMILPSILDCLGLWNDEDDGLLTHVLKTGDEPLQRPVFSELTLGSFDIKPYDRLVMVREGNWKLSACLDPEIQDMTLHNMEWDPHQRNNLYGDEAYGELAEHLLGLVLAHCHQEKV